MTPLLPVNISLKRLVDIAVPFIDLHETAYIYADTALGICNTITEAQNSFTAFEKKEWQKYAACCVSIALLVSSIALSIISSTAETVVTEGSSILKESYTLSCHIIALDLKGVLFSTFYIGTSALYILSTVHGTAGLTFSYLIAQGTGELLISYNEYQNDRYLETVANIVLASIRVFQAKGLPFKNLKPKTF